MCIRRHGGIFFHEPFCETNCTELANRTTNNHSCTVHRVESTLNCRCTAQQSYDFFPCERYGGGIWDGDQGTDLTALPRPRSSGGSLRSLTASMTAARRWWADPDGAFFFLLLLSGDVDEAEGAAGSAPPHEADQKARRLRPGESARRRRAAAPGTAIGERAIEARRRAGTGPPVAVRPPRQHHHPSRLEELEPWWAGSGPWASGAFALLASWAERPSMGTYMGPSKAFISTGPRSLVDGLHSLLHGLFFSVRPSDSSGGRAAGSSWCMAMDGSEATQEFLPGMSSPSEI